MKKIFFTIVLTAFIAVYQLKAQENYYSVQYSVGFGAGDLKDFNNSASFRGMSFEYRYLKTPAVGVGFELGYNMFYDKEDYATYTKGTHSVSGIQYRYTQVVPVLAAADYYFMPHTEFNPFAGLGLGTLYSYRKLDMGMFSRNYDVWQFALRPEIGVIITTPGVDFQVSAKYFAGFKTNDTEGQQYFTLNLGFIF